MPEDRGVLREIAWREIFPWLGLVRSARIAAAPRMLLLAALGLVLTAIGWRTIGGFFSDAESLRAPVAGDATSWLDADKAWPWERPVVSPSLRSPAEFRPLDTPLVATWEWIGTPFRRLFYRDITFVRFLYAMLCALWELAVWALIGGAITRIAALALAKDSRVGLTASLKFALEKWAQYALAVLLPLGGTIAMGLVIGAVYGLIMRADFGVLVMSFFWPLLLLAALAMAILLIGLLFGWALMWPTISVEGTDSFEALNHSYSYTFQRPLQYLFYAIVAAVIGLLASYVVWMFVEAVDHLALWAMSWGSGGDRLREIEALRANLRVIQAMPEDVRPAQFTWALRTGVEVLNFWTNCIILLGVSFLFSYLWTAATAIYFLLRQSVDGREPDEVSDESEFEAFSLPPLKSDPSGVPIVVEPPKAAE